MSGGPNDGETMTDKYELSRRKMLAGLGTIGVAGAGAGLGTSALYKDTEQITDNSITAGTLDMAVTADVEAANDYWSGDLAELAKKARRRLDNAGLEDVLIVASSGLDEHKIARLLDRDPV